MRLIPLLLFFGCPSPLTVGEVGPRSARSRGGAAAPANVAAGTAARLPPLVKVPRLLALLQLLRMATEASAGVAHDGGAIV